uniref:Uncharacterized protein n=1 Tax=Alexandrium catenella TaxID=2925 RepID=A0A7S1WWT0_ALECA|mmetsp:Transcript_97178/g.258243  ORF Transcript_97178/g.258243 Transcript_97178/m.258243 type:complete len:143 (+) Transcript_97178:62-490(+)
MTMIPSTSMPFALFLLLTAGLVSGRVMQNKPKGLCYEGDGGYITNCIRRGAWGSQPDDDFEYTEKVNGDCAALGYPVSLEKYSNVVYKDAGVVGYATDQAFNNLKTDLESLILSPPAMAADFFWVAGYPKECAYFGISYHAK